MKSNFDDLLEERSEHVLSLYRAIEQRLVLSIADRINRLGITSTSVIELNRLYDMGFLDTNTLKLLEELTGEPLERFIEAIKGMVSDSIDWETHNIAYDRGLTLIKPTTDIIQPVINEIIEYVVRDVNIAKTTAIQYMQKDVKRVIDSAVLETKLGTMTEQEAVVHAVKGIAKKGITSMRYDRHNKDGTISTVDMSLEGYMRRVIRTEFIQSVGKTQEHLGKELGAELYYVSQHLGARDKGIGHKNHESWQGQVYTHDDLYTVCGYSKVDGLCGVNCRHRFFPYWEGITPLPPKIDTEENKRVYDLQQKQRKLERDVREIKLTISALESIDLEEAREEVVREKRKLRAKQKAIRNLVEENKDVLRRNYQRESVVERL